MFRKFARTFLPNPLDWKVKHCAKRGGKKILLGWNRGLGDIALGLFAIVKRIREIIPDAEITFLVRENLREGFQMLEGVQTLVAPGWKRGELCNVKRALHLLGRDPKEFDLILEKPSPTDWVRWQIGNLTPRLKWDGKWDELWKKFGLEDGFTYIGVQVVAETQHGPWRNWPLEYWKHLFDRLEKIPNVKVLLFGHGTQPVFLASNLIDLRGKTSLFELLSIIKNRCHHLVLPDSGILSITYYLDVEFPIQILSLWADRQGILKQAVASPNSKLVHRPLIGEHRDLSTVSVTTVMNYLFPLKPLQKCTRAKGNGSLEKVGAIVLAGGQGSRLGGNRPKGTFCIRGKSLFQWIVEKAPEKNFPIAIMTCPLNHEETVRFFEEHRNFGREVFFFQQEMHPFLDWRRKEISRLGPNGNGSVFKTFSQSGLSDLFLERGIDVVTVVPVDNLLADPADRTLVAHHRAENAEITLKCVARQSLDERMGALVEREGRLEVLEYFELDPSVFYPYCNTGMMAFNLLFLKKMAQVELPMRWIKKRIPGSKKEIFKGEKFIFDAFPYAKRVSALCYPRENCYAPLKSLENLPSIERLLKA